MFINKYQYVVLLICVLFFTQCKLNQLRVIEKDLNKSLPVRFINMEEFEKSRKLMLEKLPSDIIKNDTIIIMEYFPDGTGGSYSATIYESDKKKRTRYGIQKSIKKGKVQIDSLFPIDLPDPILKLVVANRLDEIKKKGNVTTLTPVTSLIINIGIRNEEKNRFNFEVLYTNKFD